MICNTYYIYPHEWELLLIMTAVIKSISALLEIHYRIHHMLETSPHSQYSNGIGTCVTYFTDSDTAMVQY